MREAVATTALRSPDWLAARLDDPRIVVVAVCREIPPQGAEPQHVQGAKLVGWKDLLWHKTDRRLAPPEVVRSRLAQLGVGEGTQLVLYGSPVQYGTYAYWALRALDVPVRPVLLDGAATAWRMLGLPLAEGHFVPLGHVSASGATAVADAPEDAFDPRGRDLATRDDVLDAVRSGGTLLVDARSREEYLGERVSPPFMGFDHGALQYGRIPGAVHVPHTDLLAPDDRYLPAEEIVYRMCGVGADSAPDIITYCRLGHRASMVWFAVRDILGGDNTRVYEGSWTEWGSMVGMPIER